MALANVAVHLARRGRRVLLVDFDLEAPGLDTFPALRPEEPLRGLVDYVAEYLETDQAPDVRDFVGKSPAFDNMLVMPSGAMARGYAASFGQIDWGALYAEREGYSLFRRPEGAMAGSVFSRLRAGRFAGPGSRTPVEFARVSFRRP